MKTCNVAKCRSVTFLGEMDLRLIWFDDERYAGTCRVEVFWRDFPIWIHSYQRQETFDATVEKYSERVKRIALLLSKRERLIR